MVVSAAAVGAVHAASAGSFDARTMGQTTAELEKGPRDFVPNTGLALVVVVVRGRPTREEASAAGSRGCSSGSGSAVVMRRPAREETPPLGRSCDDALVATVAVPRKGHFGCFFDEVGFHECCFV